MLLLLLLLLLLLSRLLLLLLQLHVAAVRCVVFITLLMTATTAEPQTQLNSAELKLQGRYKLLLICDIYYSAPEK